MCSLFCCWTFLSLSFSLSLFLSLFPPFSKFFTLSRKKEGLNERERESLLYFLSDGSYVEEIPLLAPLFSPFHFPFLSFLLLFVSIERERREKLKGRERTISYYVRERRENSFGSHNFAEVVTKLLCTTFWIVGERGREKEREPNSGMVVVLTLSLSPLLFHFSSHSSSLTFISFSLPFISIRPIFLSLFFSLSLSSRDQKIGGAKFSEWMKCFSPTEISFS